MKKILIPVFKVLWLILYYLFFKNIIIVLYLVISLWEGNLQPIKDFLNEDFLNYNIDSPLQTTYDSYKTGLDWLNNKRTTNTKNTKR